LGGVLRPDGRISQASYRARLSLQPPANSRIRPEDIKRGLTFSIGIQTGRRSVLHFISKPIARLQRRVGPKVMGKKSRNSFPTYWN
jgi:hypothetical protein